MKSGCAQPSQYCEDIPIPAPCVWKTECLRLSPYFGRNLNLTALLRACADSQQEDTFSFWHEKKSLSDDFICFRSKSIDKMSKQSLGK